MAGSDDVFVRGALFAVLSIRQPVRNVPAMLEDVERERSRSIYLFGHKHLAYEYLILNGGRLRETVCGGHATTFKALKALCQTPGLGIVKAGFVAQLAGHDVACLDSRNAQREGRDYGKEFRSGKYQGPAFERRLERYLSETGGRAAEYWDAWCTYVAPDHKLTPQEVSGLHMAIVPDDFMPF
jgi:hypothetical protein